MLLAFNLHLEVTVAQALAVDPSLSLSFFLPLWFPLVLLSISMLMPCKDRSRIGMKESVGKLAPLLSSVLL